MATKTGMSPRERVLAVLRREPVDRIPLTIYESKIPHCTTERRLRNEGLCIVDRSVNAFVQNQPSCPEETRTWTENGKERVRRIVHTPEGDLTGAYEHAGFTAWTFERLFKGPKDYKRLMAMVRGHQFRPNYEAFVEAEKWKGDDVIMRANVGPCPLHWIMIHWMGVEVFSEEWAERRDEILALEAVMRENLRRVYPILADAPITHANFSGNEIPEMMGPPRYKEFCIPLFDECAEFFRPKGIFLGTHLDGNNAAWADAVGASGLDYIEAFTPAPDTDMTIEAALAAWPDKVLWINFPSSVHLADIETIKRTTREIIAAAEGTNRLIIGITEDMPPDRWQENMLAISDVINNG